MKRLALALVLVLLVPIPVAAHSDAEVRRDVREARVWLRHRMPQRQYRCLFRLWEAESHWRVRAGARRLWSGGAFGIPQSVPGSKMARAERPRRGERWDDYREDALVQVVWGLHYLRGRYRSACRALGWQNVAGWY